MTGMDDLAAAIAGADRTAKLDASHFRAAASWEMLVGWLRLSGLAPVDARVLYGFVTAVELALKQNLIDKGIRPPELAKMEDMAVDLAQAILKESITDAETPEEIALLGGQHLREELSEKKGRL